jgi:hypothetical protein
MEQKIDRDTSGGIYFGTVVPTESYP